MLRNERRYRMMDCSGSSNVIAFMAVIFLLSSSFGVAIGQAVAEDRAFSASEPAFMVAEVPNLVPIRDSNQPDSSGGAVAEDPVALALERVGSISFKKTQLNEVIFLLSDLWKINIVAGEGITGEVSGTFHNAPLREVLSAVLTASGYSYRKTGSSLVVLPISQIGSADPDFVSRTIRLPGSLDDAETTIEAARMLLGERGQIRRIGSDSVLVIDLPERVEQVQELFSDLGGSRVGHLPSPAMPDDARTATAPSLVVNPPTQTATSEPSSAVIQNGIAYFTPQYTEAEEMGEALQIALGESVVVSTFAEENRIMVRGTADELQMAAQAIEQLDVARAQVRITALIYDVALGELEGLGVNWSHGPHSRATTLDILNDENFVYRNHATAAVSMVDETAAGQVASLALQTINNTYDAAMLIQAIDSTTESKLLADPSVTVSDRRKASMRIVQRIPILIANLDAQGRVFYTVEFQEAGIILNVTPRISRDGTIDMEVQPEHSVVVGRTENGYPIIDARTAETTVRVLDGHTFVLGGLRQKSITETVRGVPFLKDVKYIGKLFRSHNTEVRESELIVFLKPEIVTSCVPGTPRNQEAACIVNHELDAIPHATLCPQSPDCKNPYCPNHNPRERVNGGSMDLEMLGGMGIGCACEKLGVEYLGTEPLTINQGMIVEQAPTDYP